MWTVAMHVRHIGSSLTLVQQIPSASFSIPFPRPSLPLPSTPSLPLEVGPLKYSQGVWGNILSSLSGVWEGAPVEIKFGAFFP